MQYVTAALQDKILRYRLRVLAGTLWVCLNAGIVSGQPAREGISPSVEPEEFVITENDSTIYTLKLALDPSGSPAYFFRNVFTPVCFTDVCKPVHIDLFWDLLGNFTRFEVPPDKPLTKTDHKEFDEEDYTHLHRILANPESLLKGYTIFDLVDKNTYKLSDSVDAVTGATPKTIQNEVIAGAVYTCFTLWHITNGPVVGEMKSITEKKCNDKLLHRFLTSENHHYQYWALDKVVPASGNIRRDFLSDVQSIVEGKNIFVARYALDKIPASMFEASSGLQEWLLHVFASASYPMQMALLDKFEELPLTIQVTTALARHLARTNEEQFERILQLLSKQEELHNDAIREMTRTLASAERSRAVRMYQMLEGMDIRDPEVRKQLKKHKKIN